MEAEPKMAPSSLISPVARITSQLAARHTTTTPTLATSGHSHPVAVWWRGQLRAGRVQGASMSLSPDQQRAASKLRLKPKLRRVSRRGESMGPTAAGHSALGLSPSPAQPRSRRGGEM